MLIRRSAKLAALLPGLLGRRREGDLAILIYHRVGEGDREIDLPAFSFDRQMEELADAGDVVSLDEAATQGRGGVVVTFDDGSADVHRHALPVLVRRRIPAVIYAVTGWVETSGSMTWSQLRECASTGLVKIGSHTHTHALLSESSETRAADELRRSKEIIEEELQSPCDHFAYPWAVGSPAVDAIVRRTYSTAALDAWRVNRAGRTDLHRLARIPVLRSDGAGILFRAKSRGMLNGEAVFYRLARRGPWRTPDSRPSR